MVDPSARSRGGIVLDFEPFFFRNEETVFHHSLSLKFDVFEILKSSSVS